LNYLPSQNKVATNYIITSSYEMKVAFQLSNLHQTSMMPLSNDIMK